MLKKTFSILTSRSFLLSISFVLSACSGHSPIDSSRSSPGPDGEYVGWHCQGAIESSDTWNCSEQLLKGGELVSPIQVQVETDMNTRLSDSEVTVGERTGAETANDNSRVNQVSAFDISANGFTVQLGAYLSREVAERAADNISLSEGELRVRNIVDGERYLFVLVYGQYSSRQQAEIVTEQLMALNPGLNYWIRTIASMRQKD